MSDNTASIKSLSLADDKKLLDFYLDLPAAVTEFYQPFGSKVDGDIILNHLKETEAGRHISLGLFDFEDNIAGHSFILFIDTAKPVFGIGLHPRMQGHGYGGRLMEMILLSARELNLPLVTLTVIKNNAKAIALYTKVGFSIKGEETFRKPNDSFYMEKHF
jgi:RimJ/RimL family protein N-acetyltransferase